MTRESRVIFMTTLMLIAFACWTLIENGIFIFPIPLNEPLFFVSTLIFLYLNKKQWRLGFFAVITGLLWLLTTQFFWSFIYGHGDMTAFSQTLVTDFCYLGFTLMLLIAGIYFSIKQKSAIMYFLAALFVVSLIASVILNNSLLLLTSFSIMALSSQLVKAVQPFHLLWLLLFLLKAAEWISYIVN